MDIEYRINTITNISVFQILNKDIINTIEKNNWILFLIDLFVRKVKLLFIKINR
jgi:hypothetical protein